VFFVSKNGENFYRYPLPIGLVSYVCLAAGRHKPCYCNTLILPVNNTLAITAFENVFSVNLPVHYFDYGRR